jgi:hypothetical protein
VSDEAKASVSTALVRPKQSMVNSDLKMTTEQYLKTAVASGLFKDTKNIAEAYMKVTLGESMGLDPVSSMASIYIVQGKPSASTNLLASRLKQSGKYRYEVLEKSATKCSIQFFELIDDCTEEGRSFRRWVKPGPPEVYTIEMAKAAGLTKNPVWISHPTNMCFNRAMSNGIKAYAPDLVGGVPIYTPDELDPMMPVKVTADGDVVPDAEYTVSPTADANSGELTELIARTGSDPKSLCDYFKVSSVDKLSASQQAKAVQMLREKERALPKPKPEGG